MERGAEGSLGILYKVTGSLCRAPSQDGMTSVNQAAGASACDFVGGTQALVCDFLGEEHRRWSVTVWGGTDISPSQP